MTWLSRRQRGSKRHVDEVADLSQPVLTARRAVPTEWLDYNGHMTESRYLEAFADATDRFMLMIGCDADYIANGGSYFTAETHIRHVDEAHAGAVITIRTQVIQGRGKKMHLFHEMREGDRTGGNRRTFASACEPRRAAVRSHRRRMSRRRWSRWPRRIAALPLPEGAGNGPSAAPQ